MRIKIILIREVKRTKKPIELKISANYNMTESSFILKYTFNI